MTSLLERAIKDQVAKAFAGKLTRGTFRRLASTAVDSRGDVIPTTPTDYSCQGIRESFSARYKASAGIPETDVSILLLVGLFRPATTMTLADKDNLVFLGPPWNTWHKIRQVLEIDPAGASVRLQAYEIPTPS